MQVRNRQQSTSTIDGGSSLALFGGALDTRNLGVAALGTSVIRGVHEHSPGANVVVFDNGWGRRSGQVRSGVDTIEYDRLGARLSRRYHRPESLQTMYALARFGGLGNAGVKAIRQSDAVLDVSGGDSFTDMYGPKRFRMVTLPKLLTLRLGRPLVLLPQTYGPFNDPSTLAQATDVVRRAHVAWARDADSYERLVTMLGDEYDENRHRMGLDMAFGLEPTEPSGEDADTLKSWIERQGEVVGINVSGLLAGSMPKGTTRDELKVDYVAAVVAIVERFLERSNASILMVPHVLGTGEHSESDLDATLLVLGRIAPQLNDPERIRIVPTRELTANEAKYWISRCSWFFGARMHSTIAGLSTGVPTAAFSYSIKTKPVFATVGQADQVIDARTTGTNAAVDQVWDCWESRHSSAAELSGQASSARQQAKVQMAAILDAVPSR